jgi:hypothetical protein
MFWYDMAAWCETGPERLFMRVAFVAGSLNIIPKLTAEGSDTAAVPPPLPPPPPVQQDVTRWRDSGYGAACRSPLLRRLHQFNKFTNALTHFPPRWPPQPWKWTWRPMANSCFGWLNVPESVVNMPVFPIWRRWGVWPLFLALPVASSALEMDLETHGKLLLRVVERPGERRKHAGVPNLEEMGCARAKRVGKVRAVTWRNARCIPCDPQAHHLLNAVIGRGHRHRRLAVRVDVH